ncbi:MAG TPA: lipid-A-disaccharide synthase, partial [Xanthobacteraceae bacterium]|nr:lipid-A-disaccharide synthase [Xanthobacteraceae bacterium]
MTPAPLRTAQPFAIAIVAAEESGDALGAALARALVQAENTVQLSGVGGSAMRAAGIVSPFPIDELAIIGLTAIPRRLPTILRRIRETADAIVKARPQALVIIDSPDF